MKNKGALGGSPAGAARMRGGKRKIKSALSGRATGGGKGRSSAVARGGQGGEGQSRKESL